MVWWSAHFSRIIGAVGPWYVTVTLTRNTFAHFYGANQLLNQPSPGGRTRFATFAVGSWTNSCLFTIWLDGAFAQEPSQSLLPTFPFGWCKFQYSALLIGFWGLAEWSKDQSDRALFANLSVLLSTQRVPSEDQVSVNLLSTSAVVLTASVGRHCYLFGDISLEHVVCPMMTKRMISRSIPGAFDQQPGLKRSTRSKAWSNLGM